MRFRVEVVKDIVDLARKQVRDAIVQGTKDVTEACLTEANKTVPIEEGTLMRSGFAQTDAGSLTGQVAYDTPYAIAQHEDPTYRHDPGRRHHWLKDTAKENEAKYVRHMRNTAAKATGG